MAQRGALRPQTFEQQSRLLVMKTTIVISDNLKSATFGYRESQWHMSDMTNG